MRIDAPRCAQAQVAAKNRETCVRGLQRARPMRTALERLVHRVAIHYGRRRLDLRMMARYLRDGWGAGLLRARGAPAQLAAAAAATGGAGPALRCPAPGDWRESRVHERADLRAPARAGPRAAAPQPAGDRRRRAAAPDR